jgi:hypothetical protein
MNHIRWAAWGTIMLDNQEQLDRMQRRNYIRRARAELAQVGIKLECGGSTTKPHYAVVFPVVVGETTIKGVKVSKYKTHTAGGEDAFKKVCMYILEEVGDHVSSEDGSVRGAGAEA